MFTEHLWSRVLCSESQGMSRWVGLELGPQQRGWGWGWELSTQMSGAMVRESGGPWAEEFSH